MIGLGAPQATQCSRAGCSADASWRVEWRNPRIHTEDRRKVWLACDQHVEYLQGFLSSRSFPVEVLALEAPASTAPIGAAAGGTT
ncbi:hypothetical protein NY547_06945 [Cnuibacter physcomitrellae]|uniref:hypothetical protein n=1 Tax=Cnuibacter physcomitrellae TaxID=1619308 RepID=UPI00217575FD|nr:hypothetical protein [Cnuibacter physcomitrellae]MCS5496972.1 hypothetical protein [Cnuibacter physcomitrellae]